MIRTKSLLQIGCTRWGDCHFNTRYSIPIFIKEVKDEYSAAMPYKKIPGPSRFTILKDSLPGGLFSTMDLNEVLQIYHLKYGQIYKIPGIFGKPDNVFIFDPKDFETLYRTDGVWPIRRGLETVAYHRRKVRPDLFYNGGLAIEQGKAWADFRKIVNPVMMQPKIVKLYIPRIDQITDEFMERMRQIRDPDTLELPENFEDELNRWTLEAMGIIALDTRLGLIGDVNKNSKEQEFIDAAKIFFKLLVELEMKPSLWKIFPTRTFNEMIRAQDTITNFSSHFVKEAAKRISDQANGTKGPHEQSVLEKLIKIDSKVATTMAIDMIQAGVDTTSTAIISVLYSLAKNPDKQEILRNDIRKILPEKNSPLTPHNMSSLPYLRACIKEALRLNEVISGNMRDAARNIVLGGYQIPQGTTVTIQCGHVQKDDSIFRNAKQFIPERWLKNQQSELSKDARNANPFTFLPFGFGPRMCIGRRFAELEIEVFISKVIRNFHVSWEHPDLKFKALAINIPDGKLQFKLEDIQS